MCPMKEPSIDRQILQVAVPAIGGFLGMILFDVTNMLWISKLGREAVAGVASSGFLVWTMSALMQISLSGCTSLVAQAFGGSRRDEAHRIVVESTWLSLFLALSFMIAGFWAGNRPFQLMGLDSATLEPAEGYFFLLLAGFPITFLFQLAGQVFNAYGQTRQTTSSLTLALALNMILDPLFIFGGGGFPALGVKGAALATLLSQTVGLAIRWHWLRRADFVSPGPRFFSPSCGHLSRIVRIGLPNALLQGAWSMVYPVLTSLITPYGMAPLSAIGLCFRLESFPYFGAMGFGVAMSALIGQAVGRGEQHLVPRLAFRGLLMVTLLCFPFALLFVLAPGLPLRFFRQDPETLGHSMRYLQAIGVFEIFMGWELLFGGIFTGLGKTYPMLLVGIPLTLGRIPLAWWLSTPAGMGVEGIWWAISLSTFGKGIGLAALFYAQSLHAQSRHPPP